LSGYVFLKDEDWYIKRLPKEEISY
jgi:hypothetical protein